jgi:mannose-6-phosphate isomerase-like protein (cupin superfamily)
MMMGCTIVGYFAGYSLGPEKSVLAQAPAAQGQTGVPSLERPGWAPLAPDQPTKEQYWSAEGFRKMHAERVAAAAAGKPMPYLPLLLARTHTIGLMTRLPADKPVPSNITRRMSLWDDAEQHQGVSDIYLVVGGSGTMVVGGEIEKREYRPANGPGTFLLPGEFAGQPIVGGRTYKMTTGDVLNIPPDTPHQAQPGPGGMTYFLIKVNVGLYPWQIAR